MMLLVLRGLMIFPCGVSCDVEVLRGLPSDILSEFETKHNIHNALFHMLAILHVL